MTGEALKLSYRMQRGDFVALTHALAQRSVLRTILVLVAWYGGMLGFALIAIGDSGTIADLVGVIALGRAPWWIYPLLLLGLVLVLSRRLILGLVAAQVYPRNALADKDLRFTFNSEAIEGGDPEIQSLFRWSAIKRIIETQDHAFFLISRREALIVPRRAFPMAEDYEELLGFARARMVASRFSAKA